MTKILVRNISSLLIVMTILLGAIAAPAMAAASTGTVGRSFSAASVATGASITVTLTPAPTNLFSNPGYQVIETVPAGFTVTANTAAGANHVGNVWTFIQIGSGPVTYTITAPSTAGTGTFSGTFKDQNTNTGNVSGSSIITVGQSAGTVTRSFSSAIVTPGATITVTLTAAPINLFANPGYQVIETVPAGFTVTANTASGANHVGNVWTFIQIGSAPVTYTITAPSTTGTGVFSGTFKDQLTNAGTVGGSSIILTGTQSSGNVTRSKSPSTVLPDGIQTIILTPSPNNLFSSPGYQVIESIPAGFTYISTTAVGSIQGNVLTLTQLGSSPITYTIRAPSITGAYTISGAFKDQLSNLGIVSGTTGLRVGAGYDANGDGKIDRSEAIQAVIDYFSGEITRQDAIDVVVAYFTG